MEKDSIFDPKIEMANSMRCVGQALNSIASAINMNSHEYADNAADHLELAVARLRMSARHLRGEPIR